MSARSLKDSPEIRSRHSLAAHVTRSADIRSDGDPDAYLSVKRYGTTAIFLKKQAVTFVALAVVKFNQGRP